MNKRTVRKSNGEDFRFEEITVNALLSGYQERIFTVQEVVQAFLSRIEQLEGTYNAFTFINVNALEDAKEMDRLREKGTKLGPLAGIPIVIKEAVDVVGFPSTFGWAPLSKACGGIELMPTKDAPVTKRLKEAGALILGKTNIPAFSCAYNANNSWKGPTYNVVKRELSPGGSSSGTAAAVSGNFAVLGVAEETAGSIQVPAAAQSLVGIKPSFGLIPTTGVTPLAGSTRDVLGPHARTVQDAAIMLGVMAGYSEEDVKTKAAKGKVPESGYAAFLDSTSLKGKRIGLYGLGWRREELSKETQELYALAIEVLEKEGAKMITDPFAGTRFARLINAKNDLSGMETFFYDLEKYFKNLNPALSIKHVFEKTGEVPWADGGPLFLISEVINTYTALADPSVLPDMRGFMEIKSELLRIIYQVMENHALDAFVYPQMPEAIPPINIEYVKSTTVPEINISGLPLITVPAGYYQNGSPFALAFFGKMWSEAHLIGMAYAFEQATKHRVAPTLIKNKRKT